MRSAWMCAALAAVAVLASPAGAQTPVQPSGCTLTCGCDRRSCYCSRTGGTGGNCRADSSSCYVLACVTVRQGDAVARAADGSLVVVRPAQAGSADMATLRPVRWRGVAQGRRVGLDCRGAVVAEVYDRRTAVAARARTRVMAI